MSAAVTGAKPKRIQRKRTKGWKMPRNAVYVGRPTQWGNPFVIGSYARPAGKQQHPRNDEIYVDRVNCLIFFREWAVQMLDKDSSWLDPLIGKDLACWCGEGEPCHADILLELANS